jgi:hypothetical protein
MCVGTAMRISSQASLIFSPLQPCYYEANLGRAKPTEPHGIFYDLPEVGCSSTLYRLSNTVGVGLLDARQGKASQSRERDSNENWSERSRFY